MTKGWEEEYTVYGRDRRKVEENTVTSWLKYSPRGGAVAAVVVVVDVVVAAGVFVVVVAVNMGPILSVIVLQRILDTNLVNFWSKVMWFQQQQ